MNARFAERLWQSQRTPLHTRPREEQWYSRKASSGQCIRKYCHCALSPVHCSHVISQQTFPVRQLEWMWWSASPDYKRWPDQFQRDRQHDDCVGHAEHARFGICHKLQKTKCALRYCRFWKIAIYIFPRFHSIGWGLRKDLLNNLCPKGHNAVARGTFEEGLPFLALESATRWNLILYNIRLDIFRHLDSECCATMIMTLAFGPLCTTSLKVFTHPPKRFDRIESRFRTGSQVCLLWNQDGCASATKAAHTYRCEILSYNRLGKFRTGSAHFCMFCDVLSVHFSELIYTRSRSCFWTDPFWGGLPFKMSWEPDRCEDLQECWNVKHCETYRNKRFTGRFPECYRHAARWFLRVAAMLASLLWPLTWGPRQQQEMHSPDARTNSWHRSGWPCVGVLRGLRSWTGSKNSKILGL